MTTLADTAQDVTGLRLLLGGIDADLATAAAGSPVNATVRIKRAQALVRAAAHELAHAETHYPSARTLVFEHLT